MLETIKLKITQIKELTPLIKSFKLQSIDEKHLQGFSAGAHINIEIPEHGNYPVQWRAYSLINIDINNNSQNSQSEYEIAIRREDSGNGGSLYLHNYAKIGDILNVRPPSNDFPLNIDEDDIILFAGGIGITPIASMANALKQNDRKFTLHYSARERSQIAYEAELQNAFDDELRLHFDNEANALNIERILSRANPCQPIYVCGPKGMIDAIMNLAKQKSWNENNLHTELFTSAAPHETDCEFEVEIKSSGKTIIVGAKETLLDALVRNKIEPLYDCRNGYCGLCSVNVISGEIDHRDTYLLDEDKAKGNVIQACVSRGKSKLVLDL